MIAFMLSALVGVFMQVEPATDRPLRHEVVVEARIDEVWAAWTTEPGVESWLARNAKIELTPGGQYATNGFGEVGEDGTADLTVLAFDPGRTLAFTTSAPADEFPEFAAAGDTWAVVSLYPIDDGHPRVEYTMLGWREGEEWDRARRFFDQADRYVLDMLRRRFAGQHEPVLVERSSVRMITHTIEVDASPMVAWDAITTRDGLSTWLGQVDSVDLRFGGAFQIGSGDNATFERIIAYDPQRVLMTRLDVPPALEATMGPVERTWIVTRIEAGADGRTQITRSMLGWGSGPEWKPARMFFEATLAQQVRDLGRALGQRTVTESTDSSEPVRGQAVIGEMLRSWTGTWEADVVDPDGVPTVVRNTIKPGPGGHGLTITGSFLTRRASRLHASTLVWLNPGGDAARFLCLEESGDLAQGEITLVGDALAWQWRTTDPEGREASFRVRMTPEGPNAYQLRMLDDKSEKPLLEARFVRLAETGAIGDAGDGQ